MTVGKEAASATVPDEPVFAEPWEARIFALIVALQGRREIAWSDFQALLIEEIGAAERSGRPRPYYDSWLAAAERLLDSLGLAGRAEVEAEIARLRPDDRTVRLRGVQPASNTMPWASGRSRE